MPTTAARPLRRARHPAARSLTLSLGALLALTGITAATAGPEPGATGEERSYSRAERGRFLGSPFGSETGIAATVQAVKANGAATHLDHRSVSLPNERPFETYRIYRYRFPARCGGATFSVYEGYKLQILEYEHAEADGTVVKVRDYIDGPGPYCSAGLWGPYDHTADSIDSMFLLSGRGDQDGLGLHPGAYEVGWMTGLEAPRRQALGQAYGEAVAAAAACPRGALLETAARTPSPSLASRRSFSDDGGQRYTVQAQDTLSTIAYKVYGDRAMWRRVYERNADVIGSDPDALRPGLVLTLP